MKKDLLIIIPARSGSKRIKNKNMKIFGSKSLLGHKIISCLKSGVGRVLVSTDSKKIAEDSKRKGAEVPFLRPKRLSTSKASTVSCVLHALRFLKEKGDKLPRYVAVLPATNPFLKISSIKNAYKNLKKSNKFNSILGYTHSREHTFHYININNGLKFDILKFKKSKYSDYERTQDWPKAYVASAALKISKTSYFLKYINNSSSTLNKKTFDMKSCKGHLITNIESFDINNINDLIIGKSIFKNLKTLH